jgi:hypothetical protein
MIKNALIIILVIVIIYLYYQHKKQLHLTPLDSERTLFGFEEEQLPEKVKDLETQLSQAQILEQSNQTKLSEQSSEILNLKNRLNVYEGVSASGSGESEKLKAVLDERDELKRTNQNLTLDKEKLTEDLNSILTE